MNDYLNHIAQRNVSQRKYLRLLEDGRFSSWLGLQSRSYLRGSIHFGSDFRVNNRNREFGSFPYGYFNAKWILIPDTYSSTLKWFHRDGFKNIIPDFALRATSYDYWVNRRRYLKYWFSEFEIYKLLKTDVIINFLIDFDFKICSFFSKYFFFDFLLIEIKYWLFDLLFLNSLITSSVHSVTPDILVDFCSTYRFFCVKLLLAVSDRWLWLIMGMFKMFFSTTYYFVYDDIFGLFMLYRGTLNMVHSYIPLDPMGFRGSTHYRMFTSATPSNIVNLLPLKFTRRKAHWLAFLGYRKNIERWDYYHRQGNFLSRFYFSNLSNDKEKYLNYKKRFRPLMDLKQLADSFPKLYKAPILYTGRVFRQPFEQTKMSGLAKFDNIISYQTIIIKPYLHILEHMDFTNLRSTKRIKSWKYIKPIFAVHQKTNYFFSIQNELLRSFFQIPSNSGNPLTGPGKNKLGHGFNKPLFGQIAPTDLLTNHFFVSSSNYAGMPKIEFSRDFHVLKIGGEYVQSSRVPLNYSIYRPFRFRFDYHPSLMFFNSKSWMKNYNDDPFRKSLFYFFQWDWAGGFFREFFFAPFHSGFYKISGSFPQKFRTPIDEYSVPYWLKFLRTISNPRFYNVNRSFDFISSSNTNL